MFILVKTKPICRGMAWLQFQKEIWNETFKKTGLGVRFTKVKTLLSWSLIVNCPNKNLLVDETVIVELGESRPRKNNEKK